MTEQEELELLKQKSPYALPDNPSQSGWSTDQIKRKHYEGLFFLYDLFKQQRINIAADVEAMQAIVDLINEEYQDIISGNPIKAKYDDENNEIKITYAKVLSLVDGTLGVLKYLKRNNSTGYIYTLEEDLEIVKSDLTKIFNGTKVVGRSYSDQNGNNISNTYVKKTDIVNDFTSYAIDKPLSANKGRELKSLIDTLFDYVGYADATDENTVIDKLREVFAFLTNVDDSQTLLDVVDGKIALVANGTNINTFAEVEAALALKANSSNVYTKTEIDSKDASALQQAKDYTDQKISEFAWMLGGNDLSVDTDSDVAYTKAVPNGVYATSGTPKAMINYVGGMSYKSENLVDITKYKSLDNTTISNESIELTNTSNLGGAFYDIADLNLSIGDTFTISSTPATTNKQIAFYNGNSWISTAGVYTTSTTLTIPNKCTRIYLIIRTDGTTFNMTNIMINKGTTALPYQPYFEGIRDSAVTSVISKDSNNTTLDTLTIPAEIQALEGYGRGINDTYKNVLDFVDKIFTCKDYFISDLSQTETREFVGGITSGGGLNWVTFAIVLNNVNQANIKSTYKYVDSGAWASTSNCLSYTAISGVNYLRYYTSASTLEAALSELSGVNFQYLRAETDYIETDISQYISDSTIQIEAGGTLTCNNTYNQAVPSEIEYLIKEAKA